MVEFRKLSDQVSIFQVNFGEIFAQLQQFYTLIFLFPFILFLEISIVNFPA